VQDRQKRKEKAAYTEVVKTRKTTINIAFKMVGDSTLTTRKLTLRLPTTPGELLLALTGKEADWGTHRLIRANGVEQGQQIRREQIIESGVEVVIGETTTSQPYRQIRVVMYEATSLIDEDTKKNKEKTGTIGVLNKEDIWAVTNYVGRRTVSEDGDQLFKLNPDLATVTKVPTANWAETMKEECREVITHGPTSVEATYITTPNAKNRGPWTERAKEDIRENDERDGWVYVKGDKSRILQDATIGERQIANSTTMVKSTTGAVPVHTPATHMNGMTEWATEKQNMLTLRITDGTRSTTFIVDKLDNIGRQSGRSPNTWN
jgi:hypothetical protein